jgi:hypothetical protein
MSDIDRAYGECPPDDCFGCGGELDENNDPNGEGLCSFACFWPWLATAIAETAADNAYAEDMAEIDRHFKAGWKLEAGKA